MTDEELQAIYDAADRYLFAHVQCENQAMGATGKRRQQLFNEYIDAANAFYELATPEALAVMAAELLSYRKAEAMS